MSHTGLPLPATAMPNGGHLIPEELSQAYEKCKYWRGGTECKTLWEVGLQVNQKSDIIKQYHRQKKSKISSGLQNITKSNKLLWLIGVTITL